MKKTMILLVLMMAMMLSGFNSINNELSEHDTVYRFEKLDDFKYEPVEVDSVKPDTLVDYTNYIYRLGGDGVLYGKPSNQESNSNIDEIIKYYKLFKQIETLEARIDSLEKKVDVLEGAVESHDPSMQNLPFYPKDEFWEWKQKYGHNFNMPMIDPEMERFKEWKARQLNIEKVTLDTVFTFEEIEIDSLCIFYPRNYPDTKYKNYDYDTILEEISDMWEAIDRINRRLK